VTVNLPAIPRDLIESTLFGHERGAFTGAIAQKIGAFERAAGGTLFLDEIGDLAMDVQSKLLRAIQEGEIERVGGHQPIRTQFRLVAATHVDLARAVQDGRFREDLYYRINVVPVQVPPLRDRQEDIPALVAHFLQRYNARFHKAVDGVTPEALRLLALYRWPGNVRELENLIERLVALTDAGWIDGEDLPLEWQLAALEGVAAEGTSRFAAARETFERSYVKRALEVCGMNVTATAAYLGVPLSTLKYTMSRLAVRPPARVSREGQPPTD
jgi:DNA-binding NtrC family response regulator